MEARSGKVNPSDYGTATKVYSGRMSFLDEKEVVVAPKAKVVVQEAPVASKPDGGAELTMEGIFGD